MATEHMVGDFAAGKKVKATDIDSVIVEKFQFLAEGNEDIRLRETEKLLYRLKANQDIQNSTKDGSVCAALEYCLSRLIKGLASPRQWARVGFATALSQVLFTFTEVKVAHVLGLIERTLIFTKQESSREQGNILLGKVTAYIAIIRSGRLSQASDLSGKDVESVARNLNQLKKSKSYLLQPCVCGLEQLITMVEKKCFLEQIYPVLEEQLTEGWEKADPDTLLLLLSSVRMGFLGKNLLQSVWGHTPLVSEKNSAALTHIVRKSAVDYPLIHRVNDVILEEVTQGEQPIGDFWNQLVLELFQSSKKRLVYLGFHYLVALLPRVNTAAQATNYLSPEVCKSINRNLSCKDEPFTKAAKSVVDGLVKLVSSSGGDLQICVLSQFINATDRFEETSRVKLLSLLIPNLNDEGAKLFAADLMKIVRGERVRADVCRRPDGMKIWAIHQLRALVTLTQIDQDWTLNLLQFLCLHTFFIVQQSHNTLPHVTVQTEGAMADHVRHSIQDSFFRAINNLTLYHSDKSQKKDLTPQLCVLYQVARYAQTLLTENGVQIISDMNTENQVELEKILDIVKTLQQKRSGERWESERSGEESRAFELLFLHLGLQLFADPKQTVDILQDLHVCYVKSSQKRSKKPSLKKEEPEWMEVLTELLLSMMSQSSRLARNTAKHVFTLLSEHVTQDTLDLIINVLHPVEEEDGDGPITFEDDLGEDEQDKSGTTTLQTEVAGESDEESDTSEEENEGEVQVDDGLRQTVKAVLGPAAADSEDDEDDEESSDMDDEAMLKFDEALSEAFRSMQQGKSREVKNRKRQLVTFKLRSLDLLESFVRSHPRPSLLVHLLSPLLDLMESGLVQKEEKQLGERARGIFHQIIRQRKIPADASVDRDNLTTMIAELIEYSTKVSSIQMVKEVSQACLFLIRILPNVDCLSEVVFPVKTRAQRVQKLETVKQDPTNQNDMYLRKVIETLHQSVNEYFHKKDCKLHHIFFYTILERHGVLMWPLSSTLLDCVSDTSIRVFLKTHACSMLALLLYPNVVISVEANEWQEFSSKFTQTLTQVLSGMKAGELKPKYTHELLLLFYRFVLANPQYVQKFGEEAKVSLELLHERLNKDGKKICTRILSKLKGNEKEKSKTKKMKKRKHETKDDQNSNLASPSAVKLSTTMSPDISVPGTQLKKNENCGINDNGHSVSEDTTQISSLESDGTGEGTPKKKKRHSRHSRCDLNGDVNRSTDKTCVAEMSPLKTRKTPRRKSVPTKTA